MSLLRLTCSVCAACAMLIASSVVRAAEPPAVSPAPAAAAAKAAGTPLRTVEMTPEQQERMDQVIRQAQDVIELDPELGGSIVWGAHFADGAAGGGQGLMLEGRLNAAAHSTKVEQIVRSILQADRYWWAGQGSLQVSASEISIGYGSEELASRFYSLGLEAFWEGDYKEADKTLSRAVAESPDDLVLRYWRVATAIALGENDRAKEKLGPLMQQEPDGSRSHGIATAFERLQGPVRQKLAEMEKKVLWTVKLQYE